MRRLDDDVHGSASASGARPSERRGRAPSDEPRERVLEEAAVEERVHDEADEDGRERDAERRSSRRRRLEHDGVAPASSAA